MPPRNAKSPAPQRRASSPAPQRQGSVIMPTLENWKWTAGNTVTGNVYGKPGTPDGTQMMTSAVPPEGKLGTHVVRVLPQSALAVATAVAAGCCGWLLRVWPPARVAACERAADARRRIVQVTESGSSYLLGKPEPAAEQGLTTGEALTLLEKEAGIDCGQWFLLFPLLAIINTLIGHFFIAPTISNAFIVAGSGPMAGLILGTIPQLINLYWVSQHGSPLFLHLLGTKMISTHSLKPWRSPVGYFVYNICMAFLLGTLIGNFLIFPCGCCGTPNQSWLEKQFSFMWVRSADYSKFMAVNEKRIRRVDKYDD